MTTIINLCRLRKYFMYNQISVRIGNSQKRILFYHNKFENLSLSPSTLHDHQYTEVIAIKTGEAIFEIEEKKYHLTDNDILVIPNQVMHSCIYTKDTYSFGFFLDENIKKPQLIKASSLFVDLFFKEIASFSEENCSLFASYISILLNSLFKTTPLKSDPVSDLGIIINEYFSKNYSEGFSLSELAKNLHLSNRQAERTIVKYTGKTFKENITERRMIVANSLMKKSNCSLNDIAKYVGYNSYSGFWKAYKAFSKDKSEKL